MSVVVRLNGVPETAHRCLPWRARAILQKEVVKRFRSFFKTNEAYLGSCVHCSTSSHHLSLVQHDTFVLETQNGWGNDRIAPLDAVVELLKRQLTTQHVICHKDDIIIHKRVRARNGHTEAA